MNWMLHLVFTYYLVTTMSHCGNGSHARVCPLWSGGLQQNVAKDRSTTSNSVSRGALLKTEPNVWVIESSGDDGTSIRSSYSMPIFVRTFPFICPHGGDAARQLLCNTSTVSKAIKRCTNSRTLKGFIGAVLSNGHLPGRLAVARVTLTNGN